MSKTGFVFILALSVASLILLEGGAHAQEQPSIGNLRGVAQTNALLSHLTVQQVPPANRCEIGGLQAYSTSFTHTTNICNEDEYAATCRSAADAHNDKCEAWCSKFGKRVSRDTCTGASSPVPPPFNEKFCNKQRSGFIDITCEVTGPCVCDP